MGTVEIELELVGSAEGVPVEVRGHGSVDTDSGQLTLDVRVPRRLQQFDSALVVLSLLDALAFMGTQSEPDDPDADVHVRSRTDLFDENGREAGGWRVVAALTRAGGAVLRLDGQLLDCRQHIEPGERVVAADAPWAVLAQPTEPESGLLAGAWHARTGRGNDYRGVTTTVITRSGCPRSSKKAPRQIDLCLLKVVRTAGSSGELASLGLEVTIDR